MNETADKILAATEIALTVFTIYLGFRVALGDDGMRQLRMRAWKLGENFSQSQAECWARRADSFSRQYEQARSVTV